MITLVPRILGFLFYYSPSHPSAEAILPALADLPAHFEQQYQDKVQTLVQAMIAEVQDEAKPEARHEALAREFSLLFEGLGEMPAPPWGSVYLDSESIVMGESTVEYRRFLASSGIALDTQMREPDDQFGLMLLAFAQLLESEKFDASTELLEQHLLPWAFRYLEVLQQVEGISPFYPNLAQVTHLYLTSLVEELELSPAEKPLFK
ncbi:molecular chaperone [Photobacterium rosenbergii]|uniref:Molecular chaperone n=1 Tax=Photobacterium rosenbergii TaxID=294936 RepID=A0ABU3ZGQ5_9GAMM|nr:molecular chaperone [Photobacterium rosenbergii]MDV5169291.1 molecular chaperone [Photobacterium rosenbergii]